MRSFALEIAKKIADMANFLAVKHVFLKIIVFPGLLFCERACAKSLTYLAKSLTYLAKNLREKSYRKF